MTPLSRRGSGHRAMAGRQTGLDGSPGRAGARRSQTRLCSHRFWRGHFLHGSPSLNFLQHFLAFLLAMAPTHQSLQRI